MQINRNNNMGLIVVKEEKRCSIFGVVSWRKKKKIQFDSKKKFNSIQAEIMMGREFVSHRVKIATLYKVT